MGYSLRKGTKPEQEKRERKVVNLPPCEIPHSQCKEDSKGLVEIPPDASYISRKQLYQQLPEIKRGNITSWSATEERNW